MPAPGPPDSAPSAPRRFSRAELARHDGSRGRCLVACRGLVYDVSASPEWRGGLHRNLHWAGQDLTAYLPDAPHGIETLARCPVVGLLEDEGAQ